MRFELAKVPIPEIRERMVGNLALVDTKLAQHVADALGFTANPHAGVNNGFTKGSAHPSPALSILASPKKPSLVTRKVAILAADGVNILDIEMVGKALQAQGAEVAGLATHLGHLGGANGGSLAVDYRIITEPSVLWDAVFVPGGAASVKTLAQSGAALLLVREQYKHAKPICAFGDGAALLETAGIHSGDAAVFATAIAQGRFFNRTAMDAMPA